MYRSVYTKLSFSLLSQFGIKLIGYYYLYSQNIYSARLCTLRYASGKLSSEIYLWCI